MHHYSIPFKVRCFYEVNLDINLPKLDRIARDPEELRSEIEENDVFAEKMQLLIPQGLIDVRCVDVRTKVQKNANALEIRNSVPSIASVVIENVKTIKTKKCEMLNSVLNSQNHEVIGSCTFMGRSLSR